MKKTSNKTCNLVNKQGLYEGVEKSMMQRSTVAYGLGFNSIIYGTGTL
jgi:hypothetical protein